MDRTVQLVPSGYGDRQALEVLDAGADVVDRTGAGTRCGVAEVGVLFEHVPAGVAGALEGDDGVADRRVAAAERAEQPVEHGVAQRRAAAVDLAGDAFAHVLEVRMDHALGRLACERHRVVAADEQVTGVEAPAHVGRVEHALAVVGGLDERADVRMQRLSEAVLVAQLVELLEHPEEVVPLGEREGAPRRPPRVDDHRGHEHRGRERRRSAGPRCGPRRGWRRVPRGRGARVARTRRSGSSRCRPTPRSAPDRRRAGTRGRRARWR